MLAASAVRQASPKLDQSLFLASLALLTFATLTAIALGAWFTSATEAYTLRSAIAMLACVGGVATSYLVWRMPSRASLGGGIGVLAFSLLRILDTGDWRGINFIIVGSTVILALPVVYAFVILPKG
ncbi:MAG: hypothetical protein ABI551_02090 [Polyangiaceae bacterium]